MWCYYQLLCSIFKINTAPADWCSFQFIKNTKWECIILLPTGRTTPSSLHFQSPKHWSDWGWLPSKSGGKRWLQPRSTQWKCKHKSMQRALQVTSPAFGHFRVNPFSFHVNLWLRTSVKSHITLCKLIYALHKDKEPLQDLRQEQTHTHSSWKGAYRYGIRPQKKWRNCRKMKSLGDSLTNAIGQSYIALQIKSLYSVWHIAQTRWLQITQTWNNSSAAV